MDCQRSHQYFKILEHKIPNSNILIDFWKPIDDKRCYYRFLTNLKTETFQQLRNSINVSDYKIYTSCFNKWYMITFFNIPPNRITEIEINKSYEIYDEDLKQTFYVIAFNANYCIGSVMFLFQGSFGNVLYTGFFRSTKSYNILENEILKEIVDENILTTVYFDNMYAADYCLFPSRAEVVKDIINLLGEKPHHKVLICLTSFGKEEVLLDIAANLNEKIYVSQLRFKLFYAVGLGEYFTTKISESRIHVYDYYINASKYLERQLKDGPHIVIHLTAFEYCRKLKNQSKDFSENIPGFYILPYSGHCNHFELMNFLSSLKPRNIKPILKAVDTSLNNFTVPQCMLDLCSKLNNNESEYDIRNTQYYSCKDMPLKIDQNISSDSDSDRDSYNTCNTSIDFNKELSECPVQLNACFIDESLLSSFDTENLALSGLRFTNHFNELRSTSTPKFAVSKVNDFILSQHSSSHHEFEIIMKKDYAPKKSLVSSLSVNSEEIIKEIVNKKIVDPNSVNNLKINQLYSHNALRKEKISKNLIENANVNKNPVVLIPKWKNNNLENKTEKMENNKIIYLRSCKKIIKNDSDHVSKNSWEENIQIKRKLQNNADEFSERVNDIQFIGSNRTRKCKFSNINSECNEISSEKKKSHGNFEENIIKKNPVVLIRDIKNDIQGVNELQKNISQNSFLVKNFENYELKNLNELSYIASESNSVGILNCNIDKSITYEIPATIVMKAKGSMQIVCDLITNVNKYQFIDENILNCSKLNDFNTARSFLCSDDGIMQKEDNGNHVSAVVVIKLNEKLQYNADSQDHELNKECTTSCTNNVRILVKSEHTSEINTTDSISSSKSHKYTINSYSNISLNDNKNMNLNQNQNDLAIDLHGEYKDNLVNELSNNENNSSTTSINSISGIRKLAGLPVKKVTKKRELPLSFYDIHCVKIPKIDPSVPKAFLNELHKKIIKNSTNVPIDRNFTNKCHIKTIENNESNFSESSVCRLDKKKFNRVDTVSKAKKVRLKNISCLPLALSYVNTNEITKNCNKKELINTLMYNSLYS